jgi:hypothetical protein
MAEIVETRDLTDPDQHSWAVEYLIRREDGEQLTVDERCWERAHEAARRAGNDEALAAIAERGVSAARELAEQAESPAGHGAVLISVWFDPADEGSLRHRLTYERAG